MDDANDWLRATVLAASGLLTIALLIWTAAAGLRLLSWRRQRRRVARWFGPAPAAVLDNAAAAQRAIRRLMIEKAKWN